jgi:hypothetical protein
MLRAPAASAPDTMRLSEVSLMDTGRARHGLSGLRRSVGAAAAVGLTAAAVAAVGAGTASAASYGCAVSGPLVTCGYVGVSGSSSWMFPPA